MVLQRLEMYTVMYLSIYWYTKICYFTSLRLFIYYNIVIIGIKFYICIIIKIIIENLTQD